MARVAMIGASGLIGRSLAPLLVEHGHRLLILARSPTGLRGAEERVGGAETWPQLLAGEQVDIAVSTLGTTWRKAGSWPAFEAVDRTAVVNFARAAKAAGARQMISVSSVGADPGSSNDYLALKGRAEADLQALAFERLDLMRPGLLTGERGADRRLGERIGIALSPVLNPFLIGKLDRFRAIPAARVAAAMAALCGATAPGIYLHSNRQIERLTRHR